MLDWYRNYLVVPDGPSAGEPLEFTREQAQFILNFYAVDPKFRGPATQGRSLVNARRVRRAVLSRPKGWGKSPIVGAVCIGEAVGEVILDGWDANGEPVGVPWNSLGFKPKVQVLAVSEDQTVNTWDPILEMCRNGPVLDAYHLDPMATFVNVPRGRIEFATAAGISREGFRPVFGAFDQTESWRPTNGGVSLAAVVRRNLTKMNGASIETPNAFVPGENSVAEKSYEAWKMQQEGKLKGADGGILFDHREAPPETDPSDRASLLRGLAYAYGESADVNGGWVSLERVLEDYWDPNTDPQDARHFFLNQITHTTDAWLSQPEWAARVDATKVVADRDMVTLGFDGSRQRARGVTDATALIGCRVSDGHLFEIKVWEQPQGEAGKTWRPPTVEVEAAVLDAFRRWNVVGFYADPALWETYIAKWEAAYGAKLRIKATRQHPIEWWMTGGRATATVRALEQFHSAVIDGELTHDGSFALTRHVLNARRRESRTGIQIGKEHPTSANKIDAAVAAVLAWQACLDAVAAGLNKKRQVPVRVR